MWIEACRDLAELADARGDAALAEEARARRGADAHGAREDVLARGSRLLRLRHPAPARDRREADRGPERARRQARLEALAPRRPRRRGHGAARGAAVVGRARGRARAVADRPPRAPAARHGLGHAPAFGPRASSTTRSPITTARSGRSSRAGRRWPPTATAGPTSATRRSMANALLRSRSALGYVTELLSGDFLAAFGRSSHHQIWSEAMVVTPIVRGLLGLEPGDGGRTLRFAPQLPADWGRVAVSRIPVGGGQVDLTMVRTACEDTITLRRSRAGGPWRALLAPSYPLDARIEAVAVDGRPAKLELERLGEIQRPGVRVEGGGRSITVVVRYRPGTDVYRRPVLPEIGARSGGLRVLRSRARRARLAPAPRGPWRKDLRPRCPLPAAAPGRAGSRGEARRAGRLQAGDRLRRPGGRLGPAPAHSPAGVAGPLCRSFSSCLRSSCVPTGAGGPVLKPVSRTSCRSRSARAWATVGVARAPRVRR